MPKSERENRKLEKRARACHLLAVDVAAATFRLAKLVKLAVEGLPVGRDAGIADEPFFGASFGHILCKA